MRPDTPEPAPLPDPEGTRRPLAVLAVLRRSHRPSCRFDPPPPRRGPPRHRPVHQEGGGDVRNLAAGVTLAAQPTTPYDRPHSRKSRGGGCTLLNRSAHTQYILRVARHNSPQELTVELIACLLTKVFRGQK